MTLGGERNEFTDDAGEDATLETDAEMMLGGDAGEAGSPCDAGISCSTMRHALFLLGLISLGCGSKVLQFEQMEDLVGSAVQTTKPVGMFGGQSCFNINACCCDSVHQQTAPVRALGNEYVGVRYRSRVDNTDEASAWRIVGAVDGTTLTWEPSTPPMAPTTLKLGQEARSRRRGPSW